MTWLQFTLWLAAAYACYYLFVIFIDAAKASRSENPDEKARLISFELESEPAKVSMAKPENETDIPASLASGGVNLKGLFELARTESIHYTAGVTF